MQVQARAVNQNVNGRSVQLINSQIRRPLNLKKDPLLEDVKGAPELADLLLHQVEVEHRTSLGLAQDRTRVLRASWARWRQ